MKINKKILFSSLLLATPLPLIGVVSCSLPSDNTVKKDDNITYNHSKAYLAFNDLKKSQNATKLFLPLQILPNQIKSPLSLKYTSANDLVNQIQTYVKMDNQIINLINTYFSDIKNVSISSNLNTKDLFVTFYFTSNKTDQDVIGFKVANGFNSNFVYSQIIPTLKPLATPILYDSISLFNQDISALNNNNSSVEGKINILKKCFDPINVDNLFLFLKNNNANINDFFLFSSINNVLVVTLKANKLNEGVILQNQSQNYVEYFTSKKMINFRNENKN